MDPAESLLPVLMALRVRGRAGVSAVAATAGLSEAEARARLAAARRAGAVSQLAAGVHALTTSGRAQLASLLAAEPIDRAALAAAYDGFLGVDRALKERITAWQLAESERRPADLDAAARDAESFAARLAGLVPRLASYARRLGAARAAIAAGDTRYVAHPAVESLHQVWFELHEDVLVTLGRARAS